MENQMVKVFENKEYEEFQLVLDSREVAEMVGKRHANLIRDIENYIEVMGQNSKLSSSNFFIERTYKQAGNGKEVKRYDVTKKGCEMVANKLTGEKDIAESAKKENDSAVDHPSYYQGKIEVIDFIEDKKLGFNLGNCVKYISRHQLKHKDNPVEDLKKARWYLNREISRIEKKGE